MLLMIQKEIQGGKSYTIHRYVIANTKYIKDYDKNKNWTIS